ncbi:MAG TPA: hypothetical protein VES79_09560 [Solirubrobacteraceae bacterium]|nr:hypothetical protein [Solirubrobacteraceae bacterium]
MTRMLTRLTAVTVGEETEDRLRVVVAGVGLARTRVFVAALPGYLLLLAVCWGTEQSIAVTKT